MKQQRYNSQQWQTIMDDFAHSGLNQSDYCQLHHLAQSTFSKWRKQLGLIRRSVSDPGIHTSEPINPQSSSSMQTSPSFEPLPLAASPSVEATPMTIQLSLGHGISLTIQTGAES